MARDKRTSPKAPPSRAELANALITVAAIIHEYHNNPSEEAATCLRDIVTRVRRFENTHRNGTLARRDEAIRRVTQFLADMMKWLYTPGEKTIPPGFRSRLKFEAADGEQPTLRSEPLDEGTLRRSTLPSFLGFDAPERASRWIADMVSRLHPEVINLEGVLLTDKARGILVKGKANDYRKAACARIGEEVGLRWRQVWTIAFDPNFKTNVSILDKSTWTALSAMMEAVALPTEVILEIGNLLERHLAIQDRMVVRADMSRRRMLSRLMQLARQDADGSKDSAETDLPAAPSEDD